MFNNFFNKLIKTEKVKEEEKRLNENDLKGYLRKFVPSNEISSGDEWETYGEGLDNNKNDDKEELTTVLTSDSKEDEMDQAYKNFNDSFQEEDKEREELVDVFEQASTDDEIKQKIWEKYLIHGSDKRVLKEHIDIEHKEKKISPREEKKMVKGMSPHKRVSSEDDVKIKFRGGKDNLKTISDQKRERMAREKIAKILDSQQG